MKKILNYMGTLVCCLILFFCCIQSAYAEGFGGGSRSGYFSTGGFGSGTIMTEVSYDALSELCIIVNDQIHQGLFDDSAPFNSTSLELAATVRYDTENGLWVISVKSGSTYYNLRNNSGGLYVARYESDSVLYTIESMVQNIYDRLNTLTNTLAMQDPLEEWLRLFHAQIEVVQLRQELVNVQLDELIEAVENISISADGSTFNFDTTPITDKLDEVIGAVDGIDLDTLPITDRLDSVLDTVNGMSGDLSSIAEVLAEFDGDFITNMLRDITISVIYLGDEQLSTISSKLDGLSDVTAAVEQLNVDFNETFSDLRSMDLKETTQTFSGLSSLDWDSSVNGLFSAVLSDPMAKVDLYRIPEMNSGLYVPEGDTIQILSETGFPDTLELTYDGVVHSVPLYNPDGTSAIQGKNLFMDYEEMAACYEDGVFRITGGIMIDMGSNLDGDVPGQYVVSFKSFSSTSPTRSPYMRFVSADPNSTMFATTNFSLNSIVVDRPYGLGTFMFKAGNSPGNGFDTTVTATIENFKLERGTVVTDFAPTVYTISSIHRENKGTWYALDTSGVKHYFGYESAATLESAFNYQTLTDVSVLSFMDGENWIHVDKGTLTIKYNTGMKFFAWCLNWAYDSRSWWDKKLSDFQTGGSSDLSPVLDRMDTIIESLGAEMGVTGCEHAYVSEINQEQTCILPGLQTFTCESCGSSYSEILESLGHDWQCTDHVEDELDPETGEVISTGYDIYTCSRCSDSYNDYEGSGAPAAESTSLTGIVSRVFEKLGSLVGDLLSMGVRLLDKLLTGFDDLVTSFNEKTQQIVNFGSGYTAWLSGFWDIVPSDLQLAFGFCLVVVCVGIVGKKLFFTL